MKLLRWMLAPVLVMMLAQPTVVQAQTEEPDINAFVYVDKEPNPTNLEAVRSTMAYPTEAIEAGAEGTVVARVLVNTKGEYIKHRMVTQIHPALVAAVEEKIENLSFSPAMIKDSAVMFWVNVPFAFKLLDDGDIIQGKIDELTEQLTAPDASYEIWHKRGVLRSQLDSLEDAIVDFTESLRLNPMKNKKKVAKNTYPFLIFSHYSRAAAYIGQEKYAEAIADYDQAQTYFEEMKIQDSTADETYPLIHLERGYAQGLAENYDAARKDFRWVLDNDTSLTCTAYELMADVGLAEQNYPELVKAYNGLIECKPGDPLLHYSRGYYKLESEDYDGAIKDFTVTLELSDNMNLNMASHNQTARAFQKMGRFEDALGAIRASQKINLLNPQTLIFKGKIMLEKGDKDQACKDWQQAVDFGATGTELEEIGQLLKEHCGIEIEEE
ncbi:MAG: tetratricopeptide repeat protein [Bacteroidota bacterium]